MHVPPNRTRTQDGLALGQHEGRGSELIIALSIPKPENLLQRLKVGLTCGNRCPATAPPAGTASLSRQLRTEAYAASLSMRDAA